MKDTFEDFLVQQVPQISLPDFLLNLALSAALALGLRFLYTRVGTARTNRSLFADNFLLVSMTTMLIISVVKSSLALSLGLVGALSIVRFRTALKDPQELAYLFLCIAVGLGLGADQRKVTVAGWAAISLLLLVFHRLRRGKATSLAPLMIHVSAPKESGLDIEKARRELQPHCRYLDLKQFSLGPERTECVFFAEMTGIASLQAAQAGLAASVPKADISFSDVSGIL